MSYECLVYNCNEWVQTFHFDELKDAVAFKRALAKCYDNGAFVEIWHGREQIEEA